MNSLSNVRQTRSKTRDQQANAVLNPGDDDRGSSKSSVDSFIPSIVDINGGELYDCAGCDRPNNFERFMVQCQNCDNWYHFTCANVNLATVRSVRFVCAICIRGKSEPAHSQISSISSTSSARRSRLDRELQRLEEEQKLLEDLNRERIEKERALNERELREKLERGKQFIARRHELLNQKEDDEAKSVRSSQRSVKRTEDWVRQTEATKSSGQVIVEHVPASTSTNADLSEGAPLDNPQVVHPSSTPLKIVESVISPPVGEDRVVAGSEAKSIPTTLGSITIGEGSEDSLEGAIGAEANKFDQEKDSSILPLVNLQPLADLLKVEEIVPTDGSSANLNRFGVHCYKRWSIDTGGLRKQNALPLQEQTKPEQMVIQKLMAQHQMDIETRRKREAELLNRVNSLERQHANELKLVRESEVDLRTKLNQRDREQATLKIQVETWKKLLVEEKDRRRTSETDLQDQLRRRSRECEKLRLQLVELESRNQHLRGMEQQLQSQVEAGRQREQKAIHLWKEAEREYWDLHNLAQQVINQYEDWKADSSSSLPPPPASWLEPTNIPIARCSYNNDSNSLLPLPPSPLPGKAKVDIGFPNCQQEHVAQFGVSNGRMMGMSAQISPTANIFTSMPPFHPQLSSQVLVSNNASINLGPSPQQLAARQVVTRELPSFAGDPTDWPLFISSYHHSTEACGYTNSENLLRLQRCLRGTAKDSVSSFLLHPSTVPQVLSTLQQLYGRPEQIVSNMIAKVRATPPPKPDKFETLVSFGLVVQNLCGHLKAVGLERYLTNPILLQELVDKLPTTVKFNWALYQQQVSTVDLNVFSEYMAKISSAASGVTLFASATQSSVKDERTQMKVNTHVSADQPDTNNQEETRNVEINDEIENGGEDCLNSSKLCIICNIESHQVEKCTTFNELDLDGRWEVVKRNKLCARCLMPHARWPCKGEVCGINGCPKRHHQLLHFEPPVMTDDSSS